MNYDPEKITFFAKTDARGKNTPFGIKAKDRSKHMYVIGKTGMGKSTLLENMAIQDIQNGEGMAFIDPHGSTAEKLLEYVPEERIEDVLYFAPFDMDYPVSFNVMEDVGPDKRHLVVSGLMSTFKKIWVDAWSARMEYILSNTLLALLEYPGSTLLGVNRMLSDKAYREVVVENIKDPSVRSFWVDEFAKYNERYMQEAGDAIKNKVGQFTANPLIRNIIGQSHSSFDVRAIMDEKKILIMNLSKGLVGETNANLLGSMLITRIYIAAMSRANLNGSQLAQMPNFYFYVDEFQSFANETFANILSEARKYKLNLTIAHQYIEQMEEEVRDAVFGNVGTTVAFRVGPLDAEFLEAVFTPQFLATDLVNLGFAQIYLSLMIDGIGSRPFSAVTLPPIAQSHMSYQDAIVAASRRKYACPRDEVQNKIHEWHAPIRKAPPVAVVHKPSTPVAVTSIPAPAPTPVLVPVAVPKPKVEPVPERRPPVGAVHHPAPVPTANLDDLRTILRSITTTEAQKHKVPHKTPESSTQKSDLKSALAQVLSQTTPGSQSQQTKPHIPTHQATTGHSTKERPDLPEREHVQTSKSTPPVAQVSPRTYNPSSDRTESQTISAKKVERMLRVTGNDNPPFRLP